ncbi:MAG: hypothetical protein LJE85_14785 [Gammaproteobacteria bacterium]|nr:hypothetical protein [Gammaproteobacteria bacterium]
MTIISYVVFAGLIFAQSDEYDAEKEAAERIKRQLELANEMRNQRLEKQRNKEAALEKEEMIEKRCVKLNDELRRLGERRRWYRLDDSGERVYLSDAEVRRKKQTLQQEYDQRCAENP